MAAMPVYDAKKAGVKVGNTWYNASKLSAMLGSGNRVYNASDSLALAAFKRYRASLPQAKTNSYASIIKNQFSGSALNSANKNIGKVATPIVTTYKAPTKPTTKTPTTPVSGTPSVYSDPGSSSMSQNYVQPTINPYTMRSDDELRNEASQAASGIYNPIMNALRDRQASYEQARKMGRQDLADQYAQQIADLKALALSADTQIQQQKASASQGYETGMANLAQQSLSARNTNAGQYDAVQGNLQDQLSQLGIQNQFAPNASGILKDKNFTDAMLQGIGNIGQTGLTAGKTGSDTAMSQLAANNTSQFAGLQGQAGIVKDQGLRDIDMKALENVTQGQAEIGKTQSDWNSKAYELLKALQGTEWEKYTTAGASSFDQGVKNAQLGLSAAEIAAKTTADQTANMDPVTLAYYKLNNMQGLDANRAQGYKDVLNILVNPTTISKAQTAADTAKEGNPFGEISATTHPGLQQFAGDPQHAYLKSQAYARAWNSLASRNLVSKDLGVNDPNWQQFRSLMDSVLTSNKNYNLGAL